jgi:hypothetical protein
MLSYTGVEGVEAGMIPKLATMAVIIITNKPVPK